MRRKSVKLIAVSAICVGIAWAAWNWRLEMAEMTVYHIPMVYGHQLHDALRDKCDRIMVRKGGYDCCEPVESDLVVFETRHPAIVAEVFQNLQFEPYMTSNSPIETCMCCGYPGIDFYKGNRRLAITSVQHGVKLRWEGFSTARVAFQRKGYGDAPLTKESQEWLNSFLIDHCGIDLKHPNPIARRPGAGQPATKPADKVPVKGQPSPHTSKDAPGSRMAGPHVLQKEDYRVEFP